MKTEKNAYYESVLNTRGPLGKLRLIANDKHLVAILWNGEIPNRKKYPNLVSSSDHAILSTAKNQLEEYFLGQRKKFDLPLQMDGTLFQAKVWKNLKAIPYGKTQSYGELAKKIGSQKASRAVGAANGRNPIPIVVPCHRVIGANGKLTGFAGGMKAKSFLLKHEGVAVNE